MLKTKNKLTVLYETGGSFADYSSEALEFSRDPFTVTVGASDSLYIGFYKPISDFYIEVGTANTNSVSMTLSYYNGGTFTSIDSLADATNSLQRSGFIHWDRNLDSEKKTTINSMEKFWYKIAFSGALTQTVVNGLNIVFSDDYDLQNEVPEIMDALPENETSFIKTHVAARNQIIQELRAQGRWKLDQSNGYPKDITAFDLLDISQVNEASKNLTLAKIHLNLSDSPDDVYKEKYAEYRGLYNLAMKTFYLDIDKDDDGVKDASERMDDNTAIMVRR